MPDTHSGGSAKDSLALDVEALRRKLGPVKVALIEQWIREVNGPLNEVLAGCCGPQAVALDLGCSRGDPDLPALLNTRRTFGCDVDLPGLRANTLAHACVLAPARKLPFGDSAFDVVHAKWLVEHLEDPRAEFEECARVLRPGGALVLLTPNAFSPFSLISRAMPFRWKQALKHRLFGLHEEDTFRTWYRANSRTRLDALLAAAGLCSSRFSYLPGMWTFFIFSAPHARCVRWFEHAAVRIPGMRACSTYILGVWVKAE